MCGRLITHEANPHRVMVAPEERGRDMRTSWMKPVPLCSLRLSLALRACCYALVAVHLLLSNELSAVYNCVHHVCLSVCLHAQVIMATNRADTLDPALLRPGRLDRKIEFPNPDRRQKRLVFQVRYRD